MELRSNYSYQPPREAIVGMVRVRVTFMRRLPCVCVVGVSSTVAKDLAERLRMAFDANGLEFPRLRIVINVDPIGVDPSGMQVFGQVSRLVACGALDTTIVALIRGADAPF